MKKLAIAALAAGQARSLSYGKALSLGALVCRVQVPKSLFCRVLDPRTLLYIDRPASA